jgi:hypothetical protein
MSPPFVVRPPIESRKRARRSARWDVELDTAERVHNIRDQLGKIHGRAVGLAAASSGWRALFHRVVVSAGRHRTSMLTEVARP